MREKGFVVRVVQLTEKPEVNHSVSMGASNGVNVMVGIFLHSQILLRTQKNQPL